MRKLLTILMLLVLASLSGCVACLPQYTVPPSGPVSACYPVGKDPFIPMDHNSSALNPWDFVASAMAPFLYGPPR
ncbi:MAG: hypothetical protein AB1646_18775 [Thermodesulfobacteriota bacterium]